MLPNPEILHFKTRDLVAKPLWSWQAPALYIQNNRQILSYLRVKHPVLTPLNPQHRQNSEKCL